MLRPRISRQQGTHASDLWVNLPHSEQLAVDRVPSVRLSPKVGRPAARNLTEYCTGSGVDGHGITMVCWIAVHKARDQAPLTHGGRIINPYKTNSVFSTVNATLYDLGQFLHLTDERLRFTCVGLAFRLYIADVGHSGNCETALTLAKEYTDESLTVDPNIDDLPLSLATTGIEVTTSAHAVERANAIVTSADHSELRMPLAQIALRQRNFGIKKLWHYKLGDQQ